MGTLDSGVPRAYLESMALEGKQVPVVLRGSRGRRGQQEHRGGRGKLELTGGWERRGRGERREDEEKMVRRRKQSEKPSLDLTLINSKLEPSTS